MKNIANKLSLQKIDSMKIALIGYGKMGQVIASIAIERGHSVDLIIDKENAGALYQDNLKNIDVAIEFTEPSAALSNYQKCFQCGVPVVSGTTGWLEKKGEVEEDCDKGAKFFYASNFSLGVNLFFTINKYVAKLMGKYENYRPSLEEIHHTQKLDLPSGTAITIAEGVLGNCPKLKKWENTVTNQENVLPIVSKREGDVPGTHSITYESEEDLIQIMHEAKGRKGFALGAVLAAEFLVTQKSGWYGMEDLLKL